MKPDYAIYEGSPVRFEDGEAWIYGDGKWQEFNYADALMSPLSTEAGFAERFGQLPPLPATAFQALDNLADAPK